MSRSIVLSLLFSGVLLVMNHASANETSGKDFPPMQYPLDEVKISILHQTGHRLPGSYDIQITGNGKAVQTIDKKDRREVTLSKSALVELLNEFYRIHFFELPDAYSLRREVALMDDGTLKLFSSRLADVSSQRVCIETSDFSKCLTVINDEPLAVQLLVKKIENLFKLNGVK